MEDFVTVTFTIQDIVDVLIKTGEYSEERVKNIIEAKETFKSLVFQSGQEIIKDMY